MIVYKCDHCGEVIMNVYKASVKYKIASTTIEDKDFHIFHGDLCEKCFDVLENFLCASTVNEVLKRELAE